MTDEDKPEIRYLGDVQRLALNRGDTVVLSVDAHISDEHARRLKAHLHEALGDDYRYLVLGHGIKIGVLGQDIAA